jgi:uncharacterized protein (DUF983 family)
VPDTISPTTVQNEAEPVVWRPDRDPKQPSWPVPPLLTQVWRGARGLCPACGQTHAFAGYLKVVPECSFCGAPLGSVRADDAPPYFTIFIAGHLLAPFIFGVETAFHPELWVQAAVWLPVSAILCLALLRPVKGATLGLMLKLGMVKTDDA